MPRDAPIPIADLPLQAWRGVERRLTMGQARPCQASAQGWDTDA
jgi:hypothetical protein